MKIERIKVHFISCPWISYLRGHTCTKFIFFAGEARPGGNPTVAELSANSREVKHWRHQGKTTSTDGHDWWLWWVLWSDWSDQFQTNPFSIIISSLTDIHALASTVSHNWLKKNLTNMKNSRVIVCLMCLSWTRR